MSSRTALAAAALSLLLLGGCAHHRHHPPGAPGPGPAADRPGTCPMACNRADPTRPQVSADAQAGIRLNTELLAFRVDPKGKPVTITWSLDDRTAERYRFDPRAGIVVEGRLLDEVLEVGKRRAVALGEQDQIIDCKPVDQEARAYTCVNRATATGLFKYTIRLVDREGKPALIKDPPFLNW